MKEFEVNVSDYYFSGIFIGVFYVEGIQCSYDVDRIVYNEMTIESCFTEMRRSIYNIWKMDIISLIKDY